MKIRLVVLFSFFIWGGVFGQIGFDGHSIIDRSKSVDGPQMIHSADLDGDGDFDIISTSWGEDKLAWYENIDGLGNYGIQKIISTNLPLGAGLYSADLDGDGDIDILAGDEGKVVWYENLDGIGNFGDEQIISTEVNRTTSVFAVDIDNDGDQDVLSSSEWDDKLSWYENTDGQGNFGSQQIITSSENGAKDIYASDLDGDGDFDVVASSASDTKIRWYENMDGQGNFGTGQIIISNIDGSTSIHTADLDGDGDQDIVAVSWDVSTYKGEVIWYENTNSQGNFQLKEIIISTVNGFDDVYAADLDGDNDKDIITASRVDDKISWHENEDGFGSFGSENILSTTSDIVKSISASDIDEDGDFDIIAASTGNDKLTWFENEDGLGNFSIEKIITLSPLQEPRAVYLKDIDNDGYQDVISASNFDNKIAWYRNLPDQNSFDSQIVISTEAYGAWDVISSDVDGDGDNDVISVSWDVTNVHGDRLAWYENLDGNGNFGIQNIISLNDDGLVSVFAIDIDNDNDIDIITTGFHTDKISWYENLDGLGTYDNPVDLTLNLDGVNSVFADDMDNDGDIDIIAVASNDDQVVLFENTNGQGLFSAAQVVAVLDKATSVFISDLNNDGKKDIISCSFSEDKIVWYQNSNGLSFDSEQIIATNLNGLEEVRTGDIDNDGDMDVLGVAYSDDKLTWYENLDGLGNFGSEQIIGGNLDGINSIEVGDLDLDGDIDVVSAISNDDKLMWFENIGIATNKIQGKITLDLNSNGCDSADLPIGDIMIVSSNVQEDIATFSLQNGIYQFFPSLGDYTTSVTSSFPDFYDVNPINHFSSFSTIGIIDTANFCVTSNQTINDLNVSIYPLGDARPGFDATYQLLYHNVGTTQLNGTVSLEFNDTKLNFLTASEPTTSQNNNTLTFDFENLNPFGTRTIDLTFNVLPPPTVNIDDVLSFTATINPIAGDFTEDDNIFSFDQTVIGSYDPNDIRVLEGEEVLIENADQYLHYIIRFQNTGTASAINVRVENILDEKLDWNTMQLESYSHPNRVEIKDGNEVSFIFDGIYLPDSTTNEPASHGFIAYKIKPKSDIAIGDIISSTADIFFDFNEAVVTNTVMTEIVDPVSIDENTQLRFSIFPIPTSGILMVQSESTIAQIEIYDQLGQLVLTKSNANQIDLSNLNRGFYFCKVRDESGDFGIKKVVKE